MMLLEMHKHQGPTTTASSGGRAAAATRRPHAVAHSVGPPAAAHAMPSIRPPAAAGVRPTAVRPHAVPAGVKRPAPAVAGQEPKKAKLQLPRKTVDL